jgi:hypothetical protein
MSYLATAATRGSGEASADVRVAIVTVRGRARTRGHRASGEDDPGAPPAGRPVRPFRTPSEMLASSPDE